ncbi:M24 family metallopeptidase [Nakamurella endophytica]|uniref:X-Pro dipeptidase n=1 Tax=Nakamurella endophytica TaxID=1748367 RepID=A0A917SML5_9ACTN|nr:aminopeptidase P family protein [Nakamurella endophytica]GGL86299.1 X-Pro dipeptidase [Nakamurella endophytica]
MTAAPVPASPPADPPYAARRGRLAASAAAAGIDALLVTNLLNVRYLTGFTGSNGALLLAAEGSTVAGGEPAVFCTDGRYLTQSAAQVPDLRREIDRPSDVALARQASGRLGFEAAAVTVAAHAALAAATGAELVPTQGLVEELRAVKDAGEIESLRRACAVADRALAELLAAGGVRAGRTEREIGLDLDQRMRLLGADGPSFETIVAAGAHSAVPHHRPTGAELAAGDLVKFDFGAEVDGYHSDMTRTFVLGRPADWQREIHDVVLQAQQAGRRAAVVGATGGAVDAAARDLVTAAGYGDAFLHGLGHGVGLEIHEAPGLARGLTGIIAADMCVTVEPGVYLAGRGGVRIEDSGVVRGPARPGQPEPGYEVLTTTPRELLQL